MSASAGLRRLYRVNTVPYTLRARRLSSRSKKPVSAAAPMGIAGAADLAAEGDRRMQVTEYDAGGFEVQGDAQVLLSHTAYLWRARTIEDITLDSLRIFTVVHPRPEIVVFGLGESPQRMLGRNVLQDFLDEGIAVEQMDTSNAVHTFNILNDEARPIGAALIAISPRDRYQFGDPFEAKWH